MGYAITETTYTDDDFTDVQFMTAKQKKLTLKQWIRFLDSGLSYDQWLKSKRVYDHLHLHCGHIAHFDIHGFYHAQFAQPEDRMRCLGYILRNQSAGFGGLMSIPDYSDLNAAMRAALEERWNVLNALAVDAAVENRRNEVERLNREIEGLTGGR